MLNIIANDIEVSQQEQAEITADANKKNQSALAALRGRAFLRVFNEPRNLCVQFTAVQPKTFTNFPDAELLWVGQLVSLD